MAAMLMEKMRVPGAHVFVLSEIEARELSSSLIDLAHQYDLQPNPRVVAWINLTLTCGMIYGPKILAVRAASRHPQKTAESIQQHVGQ